MLCNMNGLLRITLDEMRASHLDGRTRLKLGHLFICVVIRGWIPHEQGRDIETMCCQPLDGALPIDFGPTGDDRLGSPQVHGGNSREGSS
ncbi:hypothetical protein ACEQUB_01302 [Ralstonia syzygii]